MAHSSDTTAGGEPGARTILPLIAGVLLAALFILGLTLSGAAEDDYTYFAGLAFAGFSLLITGRYFGRLLP